MHTIAHVDVINAQVFRIAAPCDLFEPSFAGLRINFSRISVAPALSEEEIDAMGKLCPSARFVRKDNRTLIVCAPHYTDAFCELMRKLARDSETIQGRSVSGRILASPWMVWNCSWYVEADAVQIARCLGGDPPAEVLFDRSDLDALREIYGSQFRINMPKCLHGVSPTIVWVQRFPRTLGQAAALACLRSGTSAPDCEKVKRQKLAQLWAPPLYARLHYIYHTLPKGLLELTV